MTNKPAKSIASIVWFSIVASILTIIIKWLAYYFTGSVGFLSDAMESFVNLITGIVAFIMLTIAAKPPDKDHPFGHEKAEYFSSFIEGVLIVAAALGIIYTAVQRFFTPVPLQELNLGMALSILATLINFATSRILMHYSRKHNSITLEAEAKHLMTDVWTTVGIVLGILIVKFTGFLVLDPIIAVLVGLSIVRTGVLLITRSTHGLMDMRISEAELEKVKAVLEKHREKGFEYHALHTRQAASKSFVNFHLLIPGDRTLQEAHDYADIIEEDIKAVIPNSDVLIHLEPLTEWELHHTQ